MHCEEKHMDKFNKKKFKLPEEILNEIEKIRNDNISSSIELTKKPIQRRKGSTHPLRLCCYASLR